jgi:ABC-type amino acid transport system permease subunit
MVIRQEVILLVLLGMAIFAMASLEHFDNLSGRLWISILAVQGVPYLATLATLLVSIAPHYGKNAKAAEELDEEY